MLKIALIRHGATRGNLEGRYIGVTDEPLCPEGREGLKEGHYPAVSKVYVSPLKRCLETAEALYPGIPKEILPAFRECDFGAFENKNYKELSKNPAYQAWIDSGGKLPFPEGEDQEEVQARYTKAFEELVEAHVEEEKTIALISHGGTMMHLLSRFALPERSFYDWQVKNGQGYLLEISRKQWSDEKKAAVRQRIGGREC